VGDDVRTKIVIFSFLLLCFLVVPGSAIGWEQSFEEHPNDESLSTFTGSSGVVKAVADHGNVYQVTSNQDAIRYVYIDRPFQAYLAFDISGRYSGGSNDKTTMYITLQNSSGSTILSTSQDFAVGTLDGYNFWKNNRIEIEEAAGGTGINLYRNGTLINSFSFTNPAAYDDTGNITIGFKTFVLSSSSRTYNLDNFVGVYSGMVGCDNSADYQDDYQYFKVGFPVLENSYWYVNLYSPADVLLETKNMTSCTEYGFNTTLMNEAGEYNIKLFQHYNITNGNYYFGERSFAFTMPDAGYISVNVTEAEFGDKIKITSVLNEYADDYTVRVTSSGTLLQTYEVDGEIKSYYYTIPETLTSNYLFVYLVDPDGDVVDFEQIKILNNAADPSLTLDKDTYTNNDTMYVYYYYMPIGTKLTATFYYNGDSVRSSTVTLNDVVGSEAFTIGGTVADLVFIEAYDDDTDEVYASATANILRGSYRISGKVYDAETGAPVSGATIISEGFSATTNSLGEYSANTFPGSINITVAATGYEDLHSAAYVTSVNTVKNFYLVPTSVSGTGSSLYGSVTDYYNGSALSGCYVRLQNGSVSYSALTTSKGYYSIEKSDLSGTWTVSVSKTGYDTYSSSVLISGDTYLGVRLVPTGGATADPDSTADDDDSSSNTSTDRPGREAARESMEQFEALVPALIVLVVIKVIRELMK
jgi:hypothetical protein